MNHPLYSSVVAWTTQYTFPVKLLTTEGEQNLFSKIVAVYFNMSVGSLKDTLEGLAFASPGLEQSQEFRKLTGGGSNCQNLKPDINLCLDKE